MFVNYKLKVADAESNGIDTTKSFTREFNGYCRELAKPYIEDAQLKDSLEREAYSWLIEDVDVSHVMMPLVDTLTHTKAGAKAQADSVKKMLENGDFFKLIVMRFSIDPAKMQNLGDMGYLPWGRTPYTFERAAHATPVNGYSEVVETPFGFHIIKVNNKRKAKSMLVQHILKLVPKGSSADVDKQAKAEIEEIRNNILNGADFAELAKVESQDPGSGRNGGELPWFTAGQMVKEFDEAAYALPIGEVSDIVKTNYGYHIIKKLDEKFPPSFEQALPNIRQRIAIDERNDAPYLSKISELKNKFAYVENNDVIDVIINNVNAAGKLDSVMISSLKVDNTIFAKYDKGNLKVSDLVSEMDLKSSEIPAPEAVDIISKAKESLVNKTIEGCAISDLIENNADFRNIVNEYRDGLLLFDISNKNVWNRANQDEEGLTKYFEENKANYAWESPKYKGYLIHAVNDSVANLVKAELPNIDVDSIPRVLRRNFQRNVKVEKVLVGKGDNARVDVCEFGADAGSVAANDKYPVYFTAQGKFIEIPESINDVRSQVVV
ncbi:MAG: peptidylprolyl isomerase, partial [Muribaculaceae bacterium]|nr:peptidylprolyl isomerase [Muribaculaceae bacterium]